MGSPTLTQAAVDHLAGRSLVLRVSPRHGCCGGQALLPVAEVGPPARPADYHTLQAGEVTCFVDPRLTDAVAGWTVDTIGIGRWRRLHLDGAQGIDPARGEEHRHV